MAIRSGEPYRLQIYEFLHALAEGGMESRFNLHVSNGEDQGASGTGLGILISPMIKVLDEMYNAQDELIKEMRSHDNAKKEWSDNDLKKLYETHQKLLDLVSLFCYIPRTKYMPLGPISAKLIDIYRTRHNISESSRAWSSGVCDPVVFATGISDLIYESTAKETPPSSSHKSDSLDDDLVNAWAANLGDDGLFSNNAPAMQRVNDFLAGAGTDAPDIEDDNAISRPSVSYDDMWAKTLLETTENEEDDGRSSGSSSPESIGSVESSISSHFGARTTYPSLFSSKPPTYSSSQRMMVHEKASGSRSHSSNPSWLMHDGHGSPTSTSTSSSSISYNDGMHSLENPLAADENNNPQYGIGAALYDFIAGGDDELNLTAGEEVEVEYEVDGWFYVKKKRAGRDGKMSGLVPVLYVNQL
jgi:hypothetical protein